MRKKANPTSTSQPPGSNWDRWQQRQLCRLWQAALLSLDIEPTLKNADVLSQFQPDRHVEFLKRREILNVQCDVDPLLPSVDHVLAGQKTSRYVDLVNVLEFAKSKNWSGLGPMEQGLSKTAVLSAGGNWVQVEDDGSMAKGEQYTLVRMGALLKILEKCLQPSNAPKRAKLLRGAGLNISALGEEMEKEIAEAAQLKNAKTVSRFTASTNRKSLAKAESELASFF